MADFFNVTIGSLKQFNFDGTDDWKKLTKALNSTSEEGTKNIVRVAYNAAIRDGEIDGTPI